MNEQSHCLRFVRAAPLACRCSLGRMRSACALCRLAAATVQSLHKASTKWHTGRQTCTQASTSCQPMHIAALESGFASAVVHMVQSHMRALHSSAQASERKRTRASE